MAKKEYGGITVDQAKRLKETGQENNRFKKLVAALSLDNAITETFFHTLKTELTNRIKYKTKEEARYVFLNT